MPILFLWIFFLLPAAPCPQTLCDLHGAGRPQGREKAGLARKHFSYILLGQGGGSWGGPVPFSGGSHGVSLHQGMERVKRDDSVTAHHTRRLYEEAVMVRITPV